MRLAHNIGTEKHSNYHTREQILNCNESIGFDGIYHNVLLNEDVLENKSGIMFVMGDYLGKDNAFDLKNVPYLERYCTLDQVNYLCDKYDFEIGWHTWSHRDLTKLTDIDEIMYEVTSPFPCKYFTYPFGLYNEIVVECVKKAGYERAYSVRNADKLINDTKDLHLKIYRDYVPWT